MGGRMMKTDATTFELRVEETNLVCPVGTTYASQQMRDRTIPVLSCEGPCIRGEIARQAANRVARHAGFKRACQGEVMSIPSSAMAHWVRGADKVVVIDGCFLRCQARQMRQMMQPDQLIEVDALALYGKYTDVFDADAVPEAERVAAAEQVADRVLETLETTIKR